TMSGSSANIFAKRVLQVSGDYFILFDYNNGTDRFAVLRYNITTGIVWARDFSGSLSNGGQNTVDMDYDGSSYLYILGDVPDNSSENLWVAKMDLNGNLTWYYEYPEAGDTANEVAWNIHYQNDSGIYIGATTSPGGTDVAGLVVVINNSGAVLNAEKIRAYPFPASPQPLTDRLYVKADNSHVYVVEQIVRSGTPYHLFLAHLNTSLAITKCATYDSPNFWLHPEFRLINGDIVLSGQYYPLSSGNQSYINQFFNASTLSFNNAARYYMTVTNGSEITLSYDPSNYNIFNTANVGSSTGSIYRIKAHAATGVTQCDSTFAADSLATDTELISFSLDIDTTGALDTLKMKPLSLTTTDTLICDTGSSARMMHLPEAADVPPAGVYPVPFDRQLYVRPGGSGALYAELYSIDGRLLQRQQFDGKDEAILSGDGLDGGIYILNIIYDSGRTETHKVIRQ
ncbi:MAG TPA: T9SS type A sorting domain-containing protein, partial [Bacteroidia bacterium]|nr:T9SS type A sorting domain-containing protein [Bacteroidia bacterium]